MLAPRRHLQPLYGRVSCREDRRGSSPPTAELPDVAVVRVVRLAGTPSNLPADRGSASGQRAQSNRFAVDGPWKFFGPLIESELWAAPVQTSADGSSVGLFRQAEVDLRCIILVVPNPMK